MNKKITKFLLFLLLISSCTTPQNYYKTYRLDDYSNFSNEKYAKNLHESKLKYYLKPKPPTPEIFQKEWDELDLVWPASGILTSTYGFRKLRKHKRMHQGIDIGARTGTAVYAAETGRIKFSGKIRGYGKSIIIKHNSTHDSLYAHLSRIVIKQNQIVHKNQLIGYVGRTGYVTGSNLHFEMRINGIAKDPLKFLPRSKDQRKVRVGESILVKNRHIAKKTSRGSNKS